MAYIQDLVEQVQIRLSKKSLDNLELTNSVWSLPGGFWRTHFIRTYGASLPNGADYEVETAVFEGLDLCYYYAHVIRKQYNNLFILYDLIYMQILLLLASQWGNIDIVQKLLDNGANIHHSYGWTLVSVARNGRTNVVNLLLDNGADIHALNDSALQMAAENGHLDTFKLLLDRGANVDVLRHKKGLPISIITCLLLWHIYRT